MCPPCRPATHARSHDAMRCAMRLRCERCHCDTKCGNGNLFPPCHRQPVDHPVPSSAVVPPVADGRWRANRERSGDRPRPWERVSTLLAIVSLALGCLSVPVPIFSDECASVLSSALLIDVAPTSWIRGGGGSSVDSARICNARSEERAKTAGHKPSDKIIFKPVLVAVNIHIINQSSGNGADLRSIQSTT